MTTTRPDSVPRYVLDGYPNEVGRDVVLAGYGQPGYGATGAADNDEPPAKRAGLNHIDAIRADAPGSSWWAMDFDSGKQENNALALSGFISDLGHGADEVFPGPADSGGPWFVDGRIVGVTSFNARLP